MSTDDLDGNRAKLSRWDIHELRLSSADPLLQEALAKRLPKEKKFQEWCDLLKANDRRAGKQFILESKDGPFALEWVTFFTDHAVRTLHLHLKVVAGRTNLEAWMKSAQ